MSAARKELKMGENVEELEPRVVRIETNMANLVAQNTEIRVDLRALTAKVDERFDKFESKFDAKFDRFDGKFDKIDEKFARVDEKFARVEEKFSKVDERFAAILEKLGELKVWAIIVIGGGVLSIVARAFHWI